MIRTETECDLCLKWTYFDNFNTANGTIGAKHGISDLVQHVRILHLGLDHESRSLWAFGLDVVLPEEAFLFGATSAWSVFVVRV